jgi:hypothetical protein
VASLSRLASPHAALAGPIPSRPDVQTGGDVALVAGPLYGCGEGPVVLDGLPCLQAVVPEGA